MSRQAEPIVKQRAVLGEGALWYGPQRVLYWVDIMRQKVFIYNPATGENKDYDVGSHVGTVVPRKGGGLMLALQNGFASLDLESSEVRYVGKVEADLPENRFNDGKCDPAGRFWAGTMNYDCVDCAGSLYVMETDHSVRKAIDGVTISNGLVWTSDAKLFYYIDSMSYEVAAFDYDISTGHIDHRRVAVRIGKDLGMPDGMSIDVEGMIWIAFYGGGHVCRFNPQTEELLETITVPEAKMVTSCAFGGANLDELYITTAGGDDIADQSLAGSLFKAKTETQGVAAFEFGG